MQNPSWNELPKLSSSFDKTLSRYPMPEEIFFISSGLQKQGKNEIFLGRPLRLSRLNGKKGVLYMYDLKRRLKEGDLLVGTMISEVRKPNVAYMLAQSGFDFFIIDNEHGAYSPETLSNMIAAANGVAELKSFTSLPFFSTRE